MYASLCHLPPTSIYIYTYVYSCFAFHHSLNYKKESFILNVYPQSLISVTAQINNLIRHNRRKEIHRTKTHDFVAPHNAISKRCKGPNEHIYLFCVFLSFLKRIRNKYVIRTTQRSLMLFHAN